jgi:hypothetical protein
VLCGDYCGYCGGCRDWVGIYHQVLEGPVIVFLSLILYFARVFNLWKLEFGDEYFDIFTCFNLLNRIELIYD